MAHAVDDLAIDRRIVTRRTVELSALSIGIAVLSALVAQSLTKLIALITNIAFFGRFSTMNASPANNHLGLAVVIVPVLGALIVGAMARWGSPAIRGHGIPEAMERVLEHDSRIPARLVLLKPISSAIAIGTGGPFGAEGPIIATGGALGSLVGQLLHTTANERKTLLAAGAAAGMTATFGSPVSAVLLAVELLLFELSPRSLLPISLATAAAAGIRIAFVGAAPVFAMEAVATPSGAALITYVGIGAVTGVISVAVTRVVYAIEDAFDRLPIHWMWWPALGAIVIGVVGYFAPHTMGVGYDNIENIVSGHLIGRALAVLCVLKFVSWAIALGSGTSGGTLAPLFTIGGALGALLGTGCAMIFPSWHIDPRIAALVGMASLFAGASRALLASIVFAFETTRQPVGILPLLAGCSAAYLSSAIFMRESIMTTKIARRGVHVPQSFSAGILEKISVKRVASPEVVVLGADQAVNVERTRIEALQSCAHQGFPVVRDQRVIGVVTRSQIEQLANADKLVADLVTRDAIVIRANSVLVEAVQLMAREHVGRLPVIDAKTGQLVGILSRSDILRAYALDLDAEHRLDRHLSWRGPIRTRLAR